MKDLSHLSVVDGAFLHLESPEMPMHVGSLALFEPPPAQQGPWFESVKAHVAGRMHLVPVFTRKLALMPFDLANPVWIDDDDIDLDYHIRYMVLAKPGTMAQMEALVARLHSSLLDRSRPLWEFYVVDGLADGRVGFYSKVHHAAVDGQAAVALANSVFDVTREPRRVRLPRTVQSNRYQLGVAELLSAALGNQLRQLLQFAKLMPPIAGAAWQAAKVAIAQRRDPTRTSDEKTDSPSPSPSRWKLAPATPFNTSITNQRAFAGVALPLPEVKAIGKAFGASVNDMVLWLCSTALREYLKDANQLPEQTLVAGVPISLRSEGDTRSNNQVSGTVVDLATQEADPILRLRQIMAGTRVMKAQMGSFGKLIPQDFPSFGSPWLLSGLASLYGRSRLADRVRLANLTISNVPGPQVPLYLAGARMSGMYPLSIVVHGVALNITVQSYLGQLCFGLIACRRAVPDVHELAEQLQRAMRALSKLSLPALALAETPMPAEVEVPAVMAGKAVAPHRKPRRKPQLKVVQSAAPSGARSVTQRVAKAAPKSAPARKPLRPRAGTTKQAR